jgi:putative NADH-flavin reductase
MNITIFGANGAIGKIVTNHALGNGDDVTAYVRRTDSMGMSHCNLHVIIGDLSNESLIGKTIENADVVISTLGPALDMSRKFKGTPIADGHEKMINAMEKLQRKRLITLATPSIHSEDDRKQFSTVVAVIMAKILFPNPFREMKKIERLIKKSSLDWTVVRIMNPNVKHENNDYSISLGDTPAKMAVSRENVGAFIYHVASDNLYIKKMPIVFNK